MKKIVVIFLTMMLARYSSAQCIVVNSELQSYINETSNQVRQIQGQIRNDVSQVAEGVYKLPDGRLSYPDWVHFEIVAERIEELNELWDETYSKHLTSILYKAYELGLIKDPAILTDDLDCAEEEIETNYFDFPEDFASIVFEELTGVESYRTLMVKEENTWLMSGPSDIFSNISMNQELDAEYWPLVTEKMYCDIRNPEVDELQIEKYFLNFHVANSNRKMNSLLMKESGIAISLHLPFLNYYVVNGTDPTLWEKISKLLGKIKSVAEVLNVVVGIGKAVWEQMADCGESKEIKERNLRYNGFPTLIDSRYIGYEIEQRSVTFDGKGSTTKIKGKAKLYKTKNGKIKGKDRRNKVGIEYCTRQFDVCNKVDYPVDGNLIVPVVGPKERAKKAKLSKLDCMQPFALAPTKSMHFLSFSFCYNSGYQKTIPLLAVNTPVTNRCR